jgi:hypothetical protein
LTRTNVAKKSTTATAFCCKRERERERERERAVGDQARPSQAHARASSRTLFSCSFVVAVLTKATAFCTDGFLERKLESGLQRPSSRLGHNKKPNAPCGGFQRHLSRGDVRFLYPAEAKRLFNCAPGGNRSQPLLPISTQREPKASLPRPASAPEAIPRRSP